MKSLMSVSAVALVIAVGACSKSAEKAAPASAPPAADATPASEKAAPAQGPASDDQGGERAGRWGGSMNRADADKDGKVTEAEFVASRHGMLDRMDEDGDAKVSRQELEATGRERMIGRVMKLDLNGDGSVDQAEFDKGTAQQFKRLDANKDGVLDQGERAAMRDRFRDRRGDGEGRGNGGEN